MKNKKVIACQILTEEILEFDDLTQVPIEIQPIDLDHFRAKLIESLG
jgi:hypothetical protein